MERYEYKIIKQVNEKELDRLGSEGWQLISVEQSKFYFLRKKERSK
jgi:hypothetical protein